MSGLINKVKDAIHSDKKDNAATDNPKSSNAGPHGSNMMNSADPRVDSDRDNIHNQGHNTGAGYGGAAGGVGHNTGAGYGAPAHHSTTAGPHSSNMMNQADPRVDSDMDGSRNFGAAGGAQHGGIGHNTGHSQGIGHQQGGIGGSNYGGGPGNPQSSNAGPHGSNMMNQADPRVDSDMDGGRNFGAAGGAQHGGIGHNTGHSQGIGHQQGGIGGSNYGGGPGNPQSSNAGPHSSNMMNTADPRVDSDMSRQQHGGQPGMGHSGQHNYNQGYGQGATTGHNQGYNQGGQGYNSSQTPGSGDANNTAGPHNSNMLNKLDPRVDSDMSGGKTYGGNATHQ